MTQPPRIYLDNAATSWPKPEAVYAAVNRYLRELGAPAGRGAYAEATEVSRDVQATRAALARLLGASDWRRVIFTCNGTDALNLAIQGVLKHGDHVVTSVVEHNSVLRPLRRLEDRQWIEVARVAADGAGVVDPDDIRRALRPNTALVVLSHASNVTGALQPVAEVCKVAQEHGALFLVDAAQSLGHLPLDVQSLGASLLAASGHKGLLGPLGTGLLYISPGVEEKLDDIRQGGTGSQSELDRQPCMLPDKYEAGNLNVPGIVGLGAGVAYLESVGLAQVRRHDLSLTQRLMEGLADLPGVTLHGPKSALDRVAVVSISVAGCDPQDVAALLDANARVQVRAGLHCAPLMHRSLGTSRLGGTVRFSMGQFNTIDHIEAALEATRQIVHLCRLPQPAAACQLR